MYEELDQRKIRSYMRQLTGKLNSLELSLQSQPSAYQGDDFAEFQRSKKIKFTYKRKCISQVSASSYKTNSSIILPKNTIAQLHTFSVLNNVEYLLNELHYQEKSSKILSLLTIASFAVGKLLAECDEQDDEMLLYAYLPSHCRG